jgi:hypothetical protein
MGRLFVVFAFLDPLSFSVWLQIIREPFAGCAKTNMNKAEHVHEGIDSLPSLL